MASMASVSAMETFAEKASAVIAKWRHWRHFWRSTGPEKAKRACQNLEATGDLEEFRGIWKNLQEFGNREVNAAQHKLDIVNRVLDWPNGFGIEIDAIARKLRTGTFISETNLQFKLNNENQFIFGNQFQIWKPLREFL